MSFESSVAVADWPVLTTVPRTSTKFSYAKIGGILARDAKKNSYIYLSMIFENMSYIMCLIVYFEALNTEYFHQYRTNLETKSVTGLTSLTASE